jgi:hypothetical protein
MAVTCCQASAAAAQTALAGPTAAPGQDHVVSARARAAVVAGVLDSLRAAYVFPDSVPAVAAALRRHERRGAYDGLTARALADSLTAHLRAARADGHLRVVYAPAPPAPPPPPVAPLVRRVAAARPTAADSAADAARESAREREAAQHANYGVDRVERLAGNVGYLALREFGEPDGAGPVLAAAMTLLARTDALVIDLRANGGGYPPTADLLASYLVGPRPVHLLSFYYRPTNQTFESWTRDTLPGPRYGPGRPVYVLTGRGTASGAEAFVYTLRHLGRVTVVGDTTAGAAHPGRDRRVGHGFAVFVPDGRPTSPVTRGNWEGTGVAPDLPVPAGRALPAAHAAALRTLLGQARDPARRRELAAALEAALAAHAPVEGAAPQPPNR